MRLAAAGFQKLDRVARDGVARGLAGLLSLGLIALVASFLAGLLILQVRRVVTRTAVDAASIEAGYHAAPGTTTRPSLER